jgi:hypothetical protein
MRQLSHDGSHTEHDDGYRVMLYCSRAGWTTWTIEESIVAAAGRIKTLAENGHSTELRRMNYNLMSQSEILAAIAAEQGT